MVSVPEQRLILRLMSYFKLAPENITLTTARFRELIVCFRKLKIDEGYSVLPEIGIVPVMFVKYEDWHKKKIDPSNPNFFSHPLKKGDVIIVGNLIKPENCK